MYFLESATGAQGIATALGTSLTSDSLFDSVAPFIPFVGAIVLFIFAYRFIRRSFLNFASGGRNRF